MPKPILEVTDDAIAEVRRLLNVRGSESLGIRIGVKKGGCSGLKYFVEYADEARKFEEMIEVSDIKILVDPKAVMYLIGSVMDYSADTFKSGFTFTNPNEKNKCGCGSSFNV